MKKINNYAMYAFYSIYFVSLGIGSFASKYLSEIGMTDSQIGLFMSVPAAICIIAQPVFGIISDRIRLKRNLLIITCIISGLLYCFANFAVTFMSLLILLTVIGVVLSPVSPISATISLENAKIGGSSFGSIRMSGTIGYQIGALIIGFILVNSLNGIYLIIGILTILCGLIAFFCPPIKGHQYGKEKTSFSEVFKNKKIVFLLIILFVACLGSAFYRSFFTKYLGDLGISNSTISVITVISIFLEIPFLFFSKKLYPKLSIWNWILLGLALNAFRMVGLGFSTNAVSVIIANIPAVTFMACFEFFPAIYINSIVKDELKGSSQTILTLTTFSISQIVGSFFGGVASDAFGVNTVFIAFGVIFALAFLIIIIPCRKLSKTV
ncbi:MAG: MFS transporter [Clostridia bacterium]